MHLRPVPHHLDASTEQERLARGPASGGPAAGANPSSGGNGGDKPAAGGGGRAIHMTIKSAMDADGGVATETMADRLRNVQTEPWRRMEWVHDEAELAWEAYNECLLLRSGVGGGAAAAQEGGDGEGGAGAGAGAEDGKGKGKEVDAAAAVDESGAADLVEKVSWLKTDWGEQELLQAVSGMEGAAVEKEKADLKGKGNQVAVKTEEQQTEGPKQAARAARVAPATSSAANPSGARRTTRRGATKSSAMEID